MALLHHLNLATMCPRGARFLTGSGGWTATSELCAHALLIETDDGLVLVDTGFGSEDCRQPKRLGRPFVAISRPRCDLAETALHRLPQLGYTPADLRHIVCTHLDLDHSGGLPDFPDASVHVFGAELDIALKPPLRERLRYIPSHFAHGPDWVRYGCGGDRWFGFESVRVIEGLDIEIALIPLTGHSAGHCGVAVNRGDGWLLHCGDAFFSHHELERPPYAPPGLGAMQALIGYDGADRSQNQARLRELAEARGDLVDLICAHDPFFLESRQGKPVEIGSPAGD